MPFPFVDRGREFFALREAADVARRVEPGVRAHVQDAVARARQKAHAASQLWDARCKAEALSLMGAAVELTAQAVGDARGALALDAPAFARLADVQARFATNAPPALDRDVGEAHAALLADARDARDAADAALAAVMRGPDDVRVLRRARAAGAAALVVAGGLLAAVTLGRQRPTARASAYVESDGGFPGSNAVDGDPATEWILPDHTPGWLDVTFARPRELHAVRLLNAHNRQYNNLATREWHAEAYAGDRLAATTRGTFPAIEPAPEWIRAPLAARGVTRVRFRVDSWHAMAGGLTEIDFE